MRVLIVDDEPVARARLRALLGELPGVEVAGEAENGRQAVELADAGVADTVLLDIRMPGMDGLEAARHLSLLGDPPAVIFVTAYDDHALAAFDLKAIDYLVKPVRRERLQQALARAAKLRGEGLRPPPPATEKARSHLCARIRGGLKLVPVADVLYFLADAKYVEAHTASGSVLLEDSLVTLEAEFPGRFVRIHRNCLVALAAIDGLRKRADGETVVTVLGSQVQLEVSRRNLPAVRRLLTR